MKVTCPTCSRAIEYSRDNPFRPFCSERCKLVDMGKWLEGAFAIEGDHVSARVDSDAPDEFGNLH